MLAEQGPTITVSHDSNSTQIFLSSTVKMQLFKSILASVALTAVTVEAACYRSGVGFPTNSGVRTHVKNMCEVCIHSKSATKAYVSPRAGIARTASTSEAHFRTFILNHGHNHHIQLTCASILEATSN